MIDYYLFGDRLSKLWLFLVQRVKSLDETVAWVDLKSEISHFVEVVYLLSMQIARLYQVAQKSHVIAR